MATESNFSYASGFYPYGDELVLFDYTEHLLLPWKRRYLVFSGNLAICLIKLNLSRNRLESAVPSGIGNVESLEALDLSRNKLVGIIPTSLADMDQLTVLDVSHNNLTGPIPLGRHLDTFNASSFMDNPNLCGGQLNKSCLTITDGSFQDPNGPKKRGERGSFRISSFYISMGIRFVAGFWAIWGPLRLSRSWNQAYFRFRGHMYDKIYVMAAITMAKLRGKLQV